MSEEANWDALLDTDAESAVRPPPVPTGTYRAYISGAEQVKSQNKGTPGIEFTFSKLEPAADVDPQQWEDFRTHKAIAGSDVSRTETFWLSAKAMFRLREFCEKAGAKADGTMKKMVNDAVGATILVVIEHTVSKRDGETVYDNITGFAADA